MLSNSFKKALAVAVILLFVSVSVAPSSGNRVSFDDITPPVTTCTLNPPEPNGNNGWYVSDVKVTLNATDDMSGVNATYYRLNEGEWETYGEPFTIESDDNYVIEYYSVDYAGNVEDWKSVEFKVDQTKPQIDLMWENLQGYEILFTAACSDYTSSIDHVEFYLDDELTWNDDTEPYEWNWIWDDENHEIFAIAYDMAGNEKIDYTDFVSPPPPPFIIGIICNPEFSEQNVTFFALIVFFSYEGIVTFQHITIPNNYEGYIGRFLITARFNL